MFSLFHFDFLEGVFLSGVVFEKSLTSESLVTKARKTVFRENGSIGGVLLNSGASLVSVTLVGVVLNGVSFSRGVTPSSGSNVSGVSR